MRESKMERKKKRRKFIESSFWCIYLDCKRCGCNTCNTKGSDLGQFFSGVTVKRVNKNTNMGAVRKPERYTAVNGGV